MRTCSTQETESETERVGGGVEEMHTEFWSEHLQEERSFGALQNVWEHKVKFDFKEVELEVTVSISGGLCEHGKNPSSSLRRKVNF
jgi:hypothetical protein